MARWEEPSSDELRRLEDHIKGEMSRRWMIRHKKADLLFDRLIELDIFREMPNPPNSYHFSEGFRKWYNKVLWNKIAKDLTANPELENINHELYKPETIRAMIAVYVENTSPKKYESITVEEMDDFTKAVGAMLSFDDESRAREKELM